jgi:hypothetical protein
MTCPQKITFGEMRESGVRDVLIYCRDHRCSHSTTISADRWGDHVRLSDIEPGLRLHRLPADVLRKCGRSSGHRLKLPAVGHSSCKTIWVFDRHHHWSS